MFQKPAFGANTTGFGMQSTFGSSPSTIASPFGGFKPAAATSAFGAPSGFGAGASTQPATGGGLFGTTNTTGGLFGATAAPAPTTGFGASGSGFGFGANTSSTGLFNTSNAGALFPQTQTNTAFGAKPQGFGFGGTPASANTGGGLFNTQQAGGSLFGQNNTMSGGGLFSTNTVAGCVDAPAPKPEGAPKALVAAAGLNPPNGDAMVEGELPNVDCIPERG